MMVAVQAGKAAEVGSCLIGGDSSFFVAGYGCDVIVESSKHPVMQIEHHVRDIGLGEHSSLFWVAVREVPSWVFGGDEVRLNVGREGRAPEEGGFAINKKHTYHARLGGVNGTNGGRVIGHQFSYAGGVSGNALG